MNTIDRTSAIIWRVLAEHEITKHAPARSVMDLADKIAAVIDRDAPTEPEASGHPEWLESDAEYDAAPIGTRAASNAWLSLTRKYDGWHMDNDYKVQPEGGRQVTRWGFGPGWEPGTDVTDRIDQAPECVIVKDRDGDYWYSNFDRWFFWLGADTGWGTAPASLTTFVDLAPITVATAEQLRAAGILPGSEQ